MFSITFINKAQWYKGLINNAAKIGHPGRIVWPQVRQICTSQTEKFSRYTLILYFSPIQYWRNCRKICQTLSDRPKIMEKFSQPADENGHVLLPGRTLPYFLLIYFIYSFHLFYLLLYLLFYLFISFILSITLFIILFIYYLFQSTVVIDYTLTTDNS